MSENTHPPIDYSRKNPYHAKITQNRKLNLEGSEKETRHLELDLGLSGITYECGDSLGVFPKNDPALVDEILVASGFTGEEIVTGSDGVEKPLRDALLTDYQITQPDKKLLSGIASRDTSAEFFHGLLNPGFKSELDRFLWGREVVDLVLEFNSVRFEPREFVSLLRKLQPRLYSIASSSKIFPASAHLTVAILRYESHGRRRKGVCSTYLAERSNDPEGIRVFVHSAKHFRLPDDPATPLIMVGPGTGIAPFRAFLQERKVTGASGRNWLFFGEQRSRCDFLYRDELEAFQKEGVLTRLDTAFSRDQDYKIYVQHRLREASKEVWKWLEEGAYFYVCGDAQKMASDVDNALHEIIQTAGGRTPEAAREYIDELKKAKRYRRDVY